MKSDTCVRIRDQPLRFMGYQPKNNGNGKKSNVGCDAGAETRAGNRGARKGSDAGRGRVPQFMITPCQSANERTLLLFIEITLGIDGSAGIGPLLIAAPDLIACPFICLYVFCSTLSCGATIINCALGTR